MCRQTDSSANMLDAIDSSPTYRSAAFDRPQRLETDNEPEVTFRPRINEDERVEHQHYGSPSITPENVNQINHLNGQFRFVDDAQRLFRPLLEAIGVNVKVRVLTSLVVNLVILRMSYFYFLFSFRASVVVH